MFDFRTTTLMCPKAVIDLYYVPWMCLRNIVPSPYSLCDNDLMPYCYNKRRHKVCECVHTCVEFGLRVRVLDVSVRVFRCRHSFLFLPDRGQLQYSVILIMQLLLTISAFDFSALEEWSVSNFNIAL